MNTFFNRTGINPLVLWGLLIFTVLGSLSIGLLVGLDHFEYVLLAAVTIGIIFLLFRPMIALFVLIPISMLGDLQEIFDFPIDLGQIFSLVLILAILIKMLSQNIPLRKPDLTIPLIIMGIATVFGLRSNYLETEILTTFISFLSLIIIYFLIFQLLDQPKKIFLTLNLFVASVTILVLIGLGALLVNQSVFDILGRQVIIVGNWGNASRLGGLYSQPNIFGQLLILVVPVTFANAIKRGSSSRIWWLLSAGLTASGLLISQSRSAILGAAIGILLVLLFSAKANRIKRLVLGLVVLVAIFGILIFTQTEEEVIERLTWEYQIEGLELASSQGIGRSVYFSIAVSEFIRNPWGIGYGQSRFLIGQALGFEEKSVHNLILTWTLELGVLGLIAGISLFFVQSLSLWHIAQEVRDPTISALISGVLGAIMATWIHNMAHATLHWLPVWIFFAISSAIVATFKHENNVEQLIVENMIQENCP